MERNVALLRPYEHDAAGIITRNDQPETFRSSAEPKSKTLMRENLNGGLTRPIRRDMYSTESPSRDETNASKSSRGRISAENSFKDGSKLVAGTFVKFSFLHRTPELSQD
jgi:hypothetical protein